MTTPSDPPGPSPGSLDGRKKRLLPRLALLLASTLVTLTVAEVLCRVRAHQNNEDTIEAAFRRPQQFSAGKGQAALGDIIQLSREDRITYELRPGMQDVIFKGAPVSTNSLGFRSPELAPAAAPGAITIFGIGDSIMFGHGVGDGESYLDVLRDLLNERHPDVEWRVINTGVPGYNAVMEVATLEKKGLAFEPDLVILGVCGNDYAPPRYVRVEDDVFDLSRSFFHEFLLEKLAGERPGSRYRDEALTHRNTWSQETGREKGTPPDRYAHLYGRDAFLGALDQLAALSDEHGFDVLAFALNDYPDAPEMMEDCGERGFPRLHMQSQIEEYFQDATGKPFSWKAMMKTDLVVNPNNGHPSVKLNRMAAERLYEALRDEGWIEEWTRGS